jgi:hypothetical protein
MEMITPDMVIENWKWYYDEGILDLKRPHIVELPPSPKFPYTVPKPVAVPAASKPESPLGSEIQLYAYLDGFGSTNGVSYLESLISALPEGKIKLTVLSNGENDAVETWCKGKDIRCGIEAKPRSRAEFMGKALEKADSDWIVWLEYPHIPTGPNWLHLALQQADGKRGALGQVRWRPISSAHMELITSAPWYKGQEPETMLNVPKRRVHYLRRGFFALPCDTMKVLEWPDTRIPDADLDLLFGEALRQRHVELINVAGVVTYM